MAPVLQPLPMWKTIKSQTGLCRTLHRLRCGISVSPSTAPCSIRVSRAPSPAAVLQRWWQSSTLLLATLTLPGTLPGGAIYPELWLVVTCAEELFLSPLQCCQHPATLPAPKLNALPVCGYGIIVLANFNQRNPAHWGAQAVQAGSGVAQQWWVSLEGVRFAVGRVTRMGAKWGS